MLEGLVEEDRELGRHWKTIHEILALGLAEKARQLRQLGLMADGIYSSNLSNALSDIDEREVEERYKQGRFE